MRKACIHCHCQMKASPNMSKVIYKDADTERSYTYAQVKNTAIDFGKGLKSVWEWQKGDVMGFFTPNCVDTPAALWGVHWAGGIVSPANPGYTTNELAFQLKDSGAKALITQKPFLAVAVEAAKQAGIPEDRIILIGDEKDTSMKFKHFSSVRNLAGTNRYRRTKANPKNDLAFLVYSSGTTGHPKGVMLCHENIVANIMMGKAGEGGNLSWNGGPDGKGDSILAFLPFFHIYGKCPWRSPNWSRGGARPASFVCRYSAQNRALTMVLGLTCLLHQAIYSGLTTLVMPKFDLEKFCNIIQTHKITFAYIVPPVVLLLGKHPVVEKYDLSSLRMLNSGAAPLTQELVEAVYKRLKVPIKQGYGLSETSPTTHTQVSAVDTPGKVPLTDSDSHGTSGTKPSAVLGHFSRTRQRNICPRKTKSSQSVKRASSGSKVRTFSKVTTTTSKAPRTHSQTMATSKRAMLATKTKTGISSLQTA